MRFSYCLLAFVPLCLPLSAQNTVTTSTGTTNSIPKYTGQSTIGPSAVSETNGNVSIGRSADGVFNAGGQSFFGDGAIYSGIGTVQIIGNAPSLAFHFPGNTIGQIALSKDAWGNNYKLRAGNPTVDGPIGFDIEGNGYFGTSPTKSTYNPGISIGNAGDNTLGSLRINFSGYRDLNSQPYYYGASIWAQHVSPCCGNNEVILTDLVFSTRDDANWASDSDTFGHLGERMRITRNGQIGIHTSTPGEALEVNGNFKLTANSGGHVIFPDSTVQSTAWTGVLSGGDYAESVDVTEERSTFTAGDLLAIDANEDGKFHKASEPYSTSVSGVYATKPGIIGRRQSQEKSNVDEVPMAMVGIVPTKVSTENGPVHRGDLLVSSSTPGYAMKGTDRSRLAGAVIGKALGSVEVGTGVIEVLISVQ